MINAIRKAFYLVRFEYSHAKWVYRLHRKVGDNKIAAVYFAVIQIGAPF